jgi:hypothetical protein
VCLFGNKKNRPAEGGPVSAKLGSIEASLALPPELFAGHCRRCAQAAKAAFAMQVLT